MNTTYTELKERYAQEPWGKLLLEMGMEPYNTESSARRVAEHAAERIEELTVALAEALAYIKAGFPELEDDDETITTSADEGLEATFHYAAALKLLKP